MMNCMCANPECDKYGCRRWHELKPHIFDKVYQPIQSGAKPHKCPVCGGVGKKENTFLPEQKENPDRFIKCNACINGIVWG